MSIEELKDKVFELVDKETHDMPKSDYKSVLYEILDEAQLRLGIILSEE